MTTGHKNSWFFIRTYHKVKNFIGFGDDYDEYTSGIGSSLNLFDYLSMFFYGSFLPLSVATDIVSNFLSGESKRPLHDALFNSVIGYTYRKFTFKQIRSIFGDAPLTKSLDSWFAKFTLADRGLKGYNTEFKGHGFTARWISEVPDRKLDEPIVLYVHGGGFVYHPLFMEIFYITNLARKLKDHRVSVLALDYDVAPETTNPTQTRQTVACIQQLLRVTDKPILLGDSCGGTLILSALLDQDGIPPKSVYGLALISPFVDPLATDGSMNTTNDIITKRVALGMTYAWLGENRSDSRAVPLNHDPEVWPRILPDNNCLVYGTDECFHDQCSEFKTLARINNYYVEKNGTHDCILRGAHNMAAHFVTNELIQWSLGHGAKGE